jgi:hypothetical protein
MIIFKNMVRLAKTAFEEPAVVLANAARPWLVFDTVSAGSGSLLSGCTTKANKYAGRPEQDF